jgi:RNA polymerase sigma-70 factor, ECF subfamily
MHTRATAGDLDAERLRQIVLEWQQPVYALAHRMLGNEADAADATQDVFVRLIAERHRLDPTRDVRPWLYRLATRVILNSIRDAGTRRRRESAAAMNSDEADARSAVEQAELQRVVEAEMRKLDDDDRSLVVLRFYQGLSQTEVAEALSLPRTTVQSRLQKALDLLRRGLASSGYAAAAPSLESLMQSSAAPSVPVHLSASLLSIAAQTGASSAGAGAAFTLGGLVMTKSVFAGALAVGLVSLGAGLWIGRSTLRADGASATSPMVRGNEKTFEELERMKADLARAVARAERAETERDRAARALREAAGGDAPLPASNVEPAAAARGPRSDASIDWSAFAKLFASNLDVIRLAVEGDHDLTPEQRSRLLALQMELSKVSERALEISRTPIFDREIFSDLARSLFEKPLGLSQAQADELARAGRALVDGELSHFDPNTASPAELWAARSRLRSGLEAALHDVVDDDQRSSVDDVWKVASHVLEGSETVVELGIAADNLPGEVVKNWNRAYDFTPDQSDAVDGVATTYVGEAESLLRRFGQVGSDVARLSTADAARLDDELLRLQFRMERELDPFLTPPQREQMRLRPPVVIFFRAGRAEHDHFSQGHGF